MTTLSCSILAWGYGFGITSVYGAVIGLSINNSLRRYHHEDDVSYYIILGAREVLNGMPVESVLSKE